jgi:hypothetical protein
MGWSTTHVTALQPAGKAASATECFVAASHASRHACCSCWRASYIYNARLAISPISQHESQFSEATANYSQTDETGRIKLPGRR